MRVSIHPDFKDVEYYEDGKRVSLVPTRATAGSAGYDLRAAERMTVYSGHKAVIRTGISIALPMTLVGDVRSRSGLASKYGIFVLNSPGTIDSDYRGEVKVILHNTGQLPFQVSPGQRIAQLVLVRIAVEEVEVVESLDSTERGTGGFGSTG